MNGYQVSTFSNQQKRSSYLIPQTWNLMLKNYFKVAIRNMMKRKAYTLLNILGLAIGMAACLIIVLFVQRELSYDNFYPKGDRIYRVALERKYPGRSTSY